MAQIRPQDMSLTFAKGMAVLEAFRAARASLTFSDVARACDLDRAAARRLVLTLVDLGYLREDNRSYQLTPRVLGLAGAYLQARRFGSLVQPLLETCARSLGETVSLAMRDGGHAIYVAQASQDPTRISFGFTVGSRLPLTATAIGWALLAAEPPHQARALIEAAEPQAHTPDTITDPDALIAEVNAARAQGVAEAARQFERGVLGIACPVKVSSGEAHAIGISIIDRDLPPERRAEIVGLLQSTASNLAHVL